MFGSSRAGASLVFICNPLRITCAAAIMAAGDWFTDKYMVLCATPYKDAPFQSMLLATAERMCHCPEMFVRPHIVVHPSGTCLYIMAELELPSEFCGFDMTTRPWYVIFARAVCDHGAIGATPYPSNCKIYDGPGGEGGYGRSHQGLLGEAASEHQNWNNTCQSSSRLPVCHRCCSDLVDGEGCFEGHGLDPDLVRVD